MLDMHNDLTRDEAIELFTMCVQRQSDIRHSLDTAFRMIREAATDGEIGVVVPLNRLPRGIVDEVRRELELRKFLVDDRHTEGGRDLGVYWLTEM